MKAMRSNLLVLFITFNFILLYSSNCYYMFFNLNYLNFSSSSYHKFTHIEPQISLLESTRTDISVNYIEYTAL
jgi:hypothetical protein